MMLKMLQLQISWIKSSFIWNFQKLRFEFMNSYWELISFRKDYKNKFELKNFSRKSLSYRSHLESITKSKHYISIV